MGTETSSLADEVAGIRWYQSLELPGGIVTPGDYDMAGAMRKIPFPEQLDGKRCLDVGTRDGYYAFEMERRGAAEVVAIDLPTQADVDLPNPRPELTPDQSAPLDERNASFDLARRALRSNVDWRPINVYDLDPGQVGSFDFAFIGTLLLHLRNPVDALNAIRKVLKPGATLMSNNPVSASLTLRRPRWPAAEVLMYPGLPFFYVPNTRGHVRMVEAGGFEVRSATRPYLFPYGAGWQRRRLRWGMGPFSNQVGQLFGALHTCVVGEAKPDP